MPKIQPITSRTQARSIGGLSVRTATSSDFGGQIGAALQQTGGELRRASAFLEQKEEEDAQRWRRKALAQFELGQTEAFVRGQETAERGGVGFVKNFQKQYSQAGKSLLESAPTERARADLEVDLARIEAGYLSKGIQFEAKARGAAARRDMLEIQEARTNAIMLDPPSFQDQLQGMVEAINAQPGLSADDREVMISTVEEDFRVAQAQGLINSATSVDAAEDVFEQLKGAEFSRSIDPRRYNQMLGLAERNIDHREREEVRREAEADKARATGRAVEFNHLLVRMARGEDVSAEIDRFHTRHNASEDATAASQWRQLAVNMESAKRAAAGTAKKESNEIEILEFMNGVYMNDAASLSPGSSSDRKMVDFHYGRMTQQWVESGMSREEINENVAQYIRRIGIVPTSVKDALKAANVNGGSPETVASAAELMESIIRQSPVALEANGLDGKSVGFLTQVQTYMNAGADAEEAVTRARELRMVPEPVREGRAAAVRGLLKDEPPTDALEKVFGDDVDFPREMLFSAKRAMEEEYVASGDLGASQAAGARRLRRTWGVTRIGGEERYAQHAPEMHYSVAGLTPEQNSRWMSKQLKDHMASGIGFEDQPLMVVPHSAVTGPDGRPAYEISVLGSDGMFHVQPEVWVPDFNETEMAKEQRERRERAVTAARVDRELNQQGIPTMRVPDDAGVLPEIFNE